MALKASTRPRPIPGANHRLRFFLDSFQVVLTAEALGVDLVYIFGARWTRGEPSAFCDHFNAADWIAIARRGGQDVLDFLARQFGQAVISCGDNLARAARCSALAGASIRSYVETPNSPSRSAYISPGSRPTRAVISAGEQRRDEAVFIGGPRGTVAAQERSAGALFAAKSKRSAQQSVHKPLESNGDLHTLCDPVWPPRDRSCCCDTTVLPTAASFRHPDRLAKR